MGSVNSIDLNKRRDLFDKFVLECNPVLIDFADLLELNNPENILTDPDAYFVVIDEYLTNQNIEDEDRSWLLVRLVYLFGVVLSKRMGADWALEDNTQSPHCGNFMLRVPTDAGLSVDVDLFGILQKYIDEPVGRSLRKYLDQVSVGL